MKNDHVLGDVIGALMLSYATIITMFQIVNRFLTPLYGALIIIAGLVAAIVFLFIHEDNRRNMRIASIACNSIAIGSIIGLLFQLLGHSMTVLSSVVIGAIFLGIVFLIYLFFYNFDSRVMPGLVGGAILLVGNIAYWYMLYPIVPANYNVYIVMFGTITLIHFIIALVVVCSDKKTIIDGMSYGYFGLSLVILVVAGIFLLIASEGDIDLDIESGIGGEGNKRSKKSSKPTRAPAKKFNYRDIDQAASAMSDLAISIDSVSTAYNDTLQQKQNYFMENSFYMAYLGSYINNVTIGQLRELNTLEQQFNDGVFSEEEYRSMLNKYKK